MTYYQEFYEACKGESVRELEKYLNKYAQLLNTQFEHDVSLFCS
jgi:type II secretory pathway component PulF